MLRFRRENRITFITNCTPEVIGDRSPHLIESDMGPRSKFDKYDSLGVDSDDKMTEHHFFLMLPLMGGFALQEKEWMIFHVGGIQDASYGKESLETSSSTKLTSVSSKQYHTNRTRERRTKHWTSYLGKGKAKLYCFMVLLG